MGAQRFAAGYRFHWRGVTYEVRQLLPEGKLSVEDLFTGGITIVELATLVQALFAGELSFAVAGAAVRSNGAPPSAAGAYVDLADCPAHLVSIARYRLAVLQPLLALGPGKCTQAAVEARVREIKATRTAGDSKLRNAVSVASVYRWYRDYTQSGLDLRALIPNTGKRGGPGGSRLGVEVEAVIAAAIQERYLVREAVTNDDVWHEVATRIEEENRFRAPPEKLRLPSPKTIGRRIGALDQRQRMAARNGAAAARRALAQHGQTAYPQVPLERVEIDHTRADLVVIDDRDDLPLGRLTLTYCLDVATRYPLGYYLGFEPPSYLTVMECLHHAIRPKEDTRERYGTEHEWIAYGIPLTLIVDNGREFSRILDTNSQLSRLFAARETLEPFPWDPGDAAGLQEFAQFVQYAQEAIGMPLPATLPRMELLYRLHYATEGVVGNLMNLLRYATLLAQEQGAETLQLPTLALAFQRRLAKHLKGRVNPFAEPEAPFVAPAADAEVRTAGAPATRRRKRAPSLGATLRTR